MGRLRYGTLALFLTPILLLMWSERSESISRDLNRSDVDALLTAEIFMFAWTTSNVDLAMGVLSKRLLESHPEHELRELLQGRENPRRAAWRIRSFVRTSKAAYRFRLETYDSYAGTERVWKQNAILLVVREAESWRIDSLPRRIPDDR